MSYITSLPPLVNPRANFNKQSELGETSILPDIDLDFNMIKLSTKENPRRDNRESNVASILENYSNASRILQIGFYPEYTVDILSNIDKKNIGNIKVTCIDNYVSINEKTEIDKKFPFIFEFIYSPISYINKRFLGTDYHLIFITVKLDDNELYNILLNFKEHYNTQIVIFFLRNLDIIRYMSDNYNIIISEILKESKGYIVDMKFSETEVKKYHFFDIYGMPTTNYILE